MQYGTLGKTGIRVSRLGFGSMRLPMVRIGEADYVDFDRAVDTIRHAFELGVNYIDSGFMYCSQESELAVGRALQGWRDRITLTTKATRQRMANPGDLRRMLEHQLRRLQVDAVDFYCFHGIGWDKFHDVDRKTGWLQDMLRAKDEGLVRHVAFSFHDEPANLIKLVDLGLFELVTCQYNYLDRRNADAIRYAHEHGVAVVAMGPVGGGRLAGLPEFLKEAGDLDTSSASRLALRFVMSNPHVDVALSGMGSREMVEQNVAAAAAGPFSDREQGTLNALLERTHALADLYCTGCGYCMPCPRGVQIPARFEAMNAFKVYGLKDHAARRYRQIRGSEAKTEGRGECTACGACESKCPQHIRIVEQLKETEAALA